MQHHVYFWLKAEHKTDESRAAFEKGLNLCKGVSHVVSGGWGKPAATADRAVTDKSWDYSLYLSFDNVEGHNAYQSDPDHDTFVAEHGHRTAKVIVMDVE